MHRIRLDCLTHSICNTIQGGVDIDHGRLLHGRTIREAYVTKIAQVKNFIRVGCQPESPEWTNRIVDNNVHGKDSWYGIIHTDPKQPKQRFRHQLFIEGWKFFPSFVC